MKSIKNRRKIFVLLAISLFLIFNSVMISNGLARTIQEEAVFNLDKEADLGPEAYGVIIPSPNTLGRVFIDGSNQGKFTVTDWLGGSPVTQIVNFPGEDISLYYPTPLSNYWAGSLGNVGEIDPWNAVQWLNVSAYNAEAETLSPFTINTVIDYYAMEEGGSFSQPFNYEHPMQIDLIIKSTGPKVLKYDWLTDAPGAVVYNHWLISPSGKPVNYYEQQAIFMGTTTLYNYLIFTANEVGTYRLIVGATYTQPASLNLEFLDTTVTSLPLNTVKFGGNFDDYATLDVTSIANWQSLWFKITGNKGDVFRLDLYQDFATGFTPTIDVWTPCANGYLRDPGFGMGPNNIYFPKTGAAYISFTDVDFEDWYRYSLLLTKAENEKFTLSNLTSFSISMDNPKTIEFSVQEDSIVRFNYSSLPNPTGAPAINASGTPNAFLFRDSKEYGCFDINTAILTRTVDSTDFFWHYMPAGTYKAIIENTNPLANGIFQISSQVYEWSEDPIPVNTLSYPMTYPSEFLTIEFQPDEDFYSLKNPIGVPIEIPDIGQFRLNTTMWATDNNGTAATSNPSQLYTYNSTTTADYYSFGYPQPAFSTDGDSTVGDYLYIGAPTRWTGMDFEFAVAGVGGTIDPWVHDTISDNFGFLGHADGTLELTQDGIIEFILTDSDFDRWGKGSPTGGSSFDIPGIDENQYYWMRLECTGDYSIGTIPIIQQITLLNNTIRGDLQFILIGENGYEYSDYWSSTSDLDQPDDLTGPFDLEVSLDDDVGVGGFYNVDGNVDDIIESEDPETIGLEGGTYKLLIIPEQWDYPGSVKVQFAVEDFWNLRQQETYDIATVSPTPNLHAIDITNFTLSGYSNITGLTYNYGLISQYNHTEGYVPYTGESYLAIECTGKPYQWTQLVTVMQGVTNYEVYVIQDLPWIHATGPNSENKRISPINVNTNRTYEFGTFSEHFTLLFEVEALVDANVTFYISLSQYDTIQLTTSDLRASYTPPLNTALIITLAIVIPSAVGAVVVVYVLKKKGRILTKTPGKK
ncbi:MAG: hypothetical protein KGD65_02795 [Candidatus Lokiarchaeota archaeon]|nr:hypothetical protein [Candidatus Lokiarchaeota archaeon]